MDFGTKKFKRAWFLLAVSTYILLGSYLLYITYSKHYLGIDLKEKNGEWVVTSSYSKQLEGRNSISEGDVILSVNNLHTEDIPNVKHDHLLRTASLLTIMKPNGQIMDVNVSRFDLPKQYFHYILVIPSCYFLLTLIIVFYLYFKQKIHLFYVYLYYLCSLFP